MERLGLACKRTGSRSWEELVATLALATVLSTHTQTGHVLGEPIHQFQLESQRLGQRGEAQCLIQRAFW